MLNKNELERELELDDFTQVLPTFKKLNPEQRERLLQIVATFFGMPIRVGSSAIGVSQNAPRQEVGGESAFSEDRSLSPKEFMLEKQPRTDIERVACLAYYLTHYRDMPHFRTIELSKLNTDAAQPKFSNAAFAAENATKRGFLVVATKGNKQLSALGEQFVQALPDRDAARAVMEKIRPRRKSKRSMQKEKPRSAHGPIERQS